MRPHSPPDLAGLWVPIVTPFAEDGTLDLVAFERLAERLLAAGVDGLVPLGTTGEPATLNAKERLEVVATCARVCARAERGLIVGAGTNSTQGTIDEVRRITERTTPTAVLIVTPYYTRPSEPAVVEHFRLVADASPVPVVIYNIPYRTGRGLSAPSIRAAAEHPNIVGLKQSVGSLDADTLELVGAELDLQILAGDDAFIGPTVLMGGAGAIAAAAHVCTREFVELVASARAGDAPRTARLAAALLPVVTAGFSEPSPAVWKAALARAGDIDSPSVRRPLAAATEQAAETLHAAATRAQELACRNRRKALDLECTPAC